MNRYPIYIPSRGRAETATTPRLLTEHGLDYFLVVEDQEYDAYAMRFPISNIIKMPGSNYGCVNYARQYMKHHAALRGHTFHWQIDDDMTSIYAHSKGVRIPKMVGEILKYVEDFVDGYVNIGLVGLSSSNFLKNKTKEFQVNTYAYGVMLVNSKTPYNYHMDVTDLDYNLGQIFSGWCTVRFDSFAFTTPTMSSRPGGCTGLPREQFIKNTLKRWPDVIPGIVVKGEGKGNVKIRLNTNAIWHRFKKSPALQKKK